MSVVKLFFEVGFFIGVIGVMLSMILLTIAMIKPTERLTVHDANRFMLYAVSLSMLCWVVLTIVSRF